MCVLSQEIVWLNTRYCHRWNKWGLSQIWDNKMKQILFKERQNRSCCSEKFRNIHRKTPVLEFLFDRIAGLKGYILDFCRLS